MNIKTKASKETTTFKVLLFIAFTVNALYFVPQAIKTLNPYWLLGVFLFLPFVAWNMRRFAITCGVLAAIGGITCSLIFHNTFQPVPSWLVILAFNLVTLLGLGQVYLWGFCSKQELES